MSNLLSQKTTRLIEDKSCVCLPYGLELLDLVRWFNLQSDGEPTFDLVSGEQEHSWRGSDVVDLFNEIRSRCENYSLADAYVVSERDGAVYFFDMHERFSFFSASRSLIDQLFPFTREIMWENFALVQEEDDDWSLQEVFEAVQSA